MKIIRSIRPAGFPNCETLHFYNKSNGDTKYKLFSHGDGQRIVTRLSVANAVNVYNDFMRGSGDQNWKIVSAFK